MNYVRRLLKGKNLSQDDLIPFLVLAINSFGGKAEKSAVDERMHEWLYSEFSKRVYREKVANNVERWKHDIAWAKERAKQHEGYVKSAVQAGRGIWELTDLGLEYAQKLVNSLESSVKLRKKKI